MEQTPLHIAASCQHVEIMRELLAVNIPHDAKDKSGNVPLHTAIRVRQKPQPSASHLNACSLLYWKFRHLGGT